MKTAQNEIAPRLLGVKAAAAQLGVSVWTLRKMAYNGRIASNKIGDRLLIPVQELDRLYAETHRPAVTEQAV